MSLYGLTVEEYGEDHQGHLLEQWKLYVEMTDKLADRRAGANNFFITVNSSIVALSPFIGTYNKVAMLVVSLVGIVVSYFWLKSIVNYKNLASARFKIINEIENKLPIRPYTYEWNLVEKGCNKKKYTKITELEKHIPKVFIGLYGIMGLIALGFIIISIAQCFIQ